MLQKYETARKFAEAYNPDIQVLCAENLERAFMGDAPTIGLLNRTYTPRQVRTWLIVQFENLNDYVGTKNKIEPNQMQMLAEVVTTEFYFLKASELLLFFHQFKAGKYGELYGSVDPLRITSALQSFCVYRREKLSVYERVASEEKREQSERERLKNAISYEDYKQQKRLKQKNKLIRLKLDGRVRIKNNQNECT